MCTIYLAFLFLLPLSEGEVSLRVNLQPPIATLECIVANNTERASVTIICPNNILCFKGCESQCSTDCERNKIDCSDSKIPFGVKYTYQFDTSNELNQGVWTCSFGREQSATWIDSNRSPERRTKKINLAVPFAVQAAILFGSSSNPTTVPTKSKKGVPVIDPTYVIILLGFLALSLCLNIVLLTRSILYQFSSKKPINSQNPTTKSCLLKFFIKFFCVENYFSLKTEMRTNQSNETISLMSRQVPSKMSDCSTTPRTQPAILLDNRPYIETSVNPHLVPASMLMRSHSFQSQQIPQSYNRLPESKTFLSNSIQIPQYSHFIPTRPSSSQMVYDDTTDSQNVLIPTKYGSSLIRQNRNKGTNENSTHRFSNPVATSDNDEELSNIAMLREESYDDTLLKDAISSRVELSKEMISQADSLLRRADNLLRQNEQ